MPLLLLAAALGVGGYLRFVGLGRLELSADEAASWAAAAAPSAAQVVRLQTRLNPGELGLHDLALHYWMAGFGDSLTAMRSLSAAFGTLAILLVFVAVREMLALAPPLPNNEGAVPERRDPRFDRNLAAATTALIFAVSLVEIKYAREARMYPLALTLGLAQVSLFARSLRDDRRVYLAGIAVTTALAAAATLTTMLVLVPEGLFLLWRLAGSRTLPIRKVVTIAIALAVGLLLVTPAVLIALHIRGGPPDSRTWEWIPPPTIGAPIALFNKATGTYAFPLLAVLAITGLVRQWAWRSAALSFALLWMFAPPIALVVVSYAIRPAFVERYLILCFVPFFALAAIGLLELNPPRFRPGALALVVAVSLMHVAAWNRKPHGAAFAEATAAAANGSSPADVIGVAPRYATSVVRYYLRDARPERTVAPVGGSSAPSVVIVGATSDPRVAADLARQYQRQLAHFDGVVVLGH